MTTMTDPINPDPSQTRQPPRPLGPGSTDADLVAWRHAAASGGLPTPTRTRWQQLRGGVVNLWEFDVEEYWCADGRAQLVGGNETGKSTLMALTTLIMLAGNLDRSNIDTFGQQHKSFRYYLEPTDTAKDRRDTSAQTNRGWAWVEYGRLVDGEPKYFTTMLYGQTKRGVSSVTSAWITCTGDARVREGITLVRGQNVLTPADVDDVPDLEKHPNGTAYRQTIARDLFGFTQADRMESTLGMLKVLRTPQLGQKLDPTWFTEEMRQALPAIEQHEIDELAEAWDQLDRHARDRDSAQEAREAVKVYLRRGWNPWTDGVLRRAADDLVTANTDFDNVTRRFRASEHALQEAGATLAECEREQEEARTRRDALDAEHQTLIQSRAYLNAQAATDRVEGLKREAAAAASTATAAAEERDRTRRLAETSDGRLEGAEADAATAREARDVAAAECVRVFAAAGIAAAHDWVTTGAVDRLETAAKERIAQVRRLEALISATERAATAHQHAESAHVTAAGQEAVRRKVAEDADDATVQALQDVSDALEVWTQSVPESAPTATLREQWVAAVTVEANSARPRAVLRARIAADWQAVVTGPLAEEAGAALSAAAGYDRQADELDATANRRERATDPTPVPPSGWTRRTRPELASGHDVRDGAPLWRLLDPVDGLADGPLAHIEAALAGGGILDAWVTPDRAWVPARDGVDAVVTMTAAGDGAGAEPAAGSLATALRVSDDAGELADTVRALLDRIAYVSEASTQDSTEILPMPYAVAADGRWVTPVTSGRAVPEQERATLLGTAARAAARQREVADLREQAASLREQARVLRETAQRLRDRVADIKAATANAPTDDDVVSTAAHAAHAATELATATAETARTEAKVRETETTLNNAQATQHEYAGDHHLPSDATLADVATAADAARSVAADFRGKLTDVGRTEVRRQELAERAAEDNAVAAQRAEDASSAAAAVTRAQLMFDTARNSLGATEKEILDHANRLETDRDNARGYAEQLEQTLRTQVGAVATAKANLQRHDADRQRVDEERERALSAWWAPVDAGLAEARGLEPVTGRSVTPALTQARQARERLQPRSWPDGPARRADRDAYVNNRLTAMVGEHLLTLNVTLEATGGRTATAVTSDDPNVLPHIAVLVDAGDPVDPVTAVAMLHAKAEELARLHDEKLQSVLEELLSSTFVEHLRDRMTGVLGLLNQVNTVLAAHPTGARQTVLRLTRVPAADQTDGYKVLETLIDGFVDSPTVQDEVRRFLERQIREAQELGSETGSEWKEHLTGLLDYRRWFDVITEFKVLTDERKRGWKALTKEIHGQDSGGAKVVTLLQPLLATLVAMYDECDHAPRPLWLDEAFEGVDADNRSTMLDLFVDFELDFLLAGPGTLVASSQVPSAAIWHVHKAPGADPGVSLALMLWAGNTLVQVNTPPPSWHEITSSDGSGDDPDAEGLWP